MLLPSLLPAFRSHSSQISLMGSSTEATAHFPVGRSAKDGKSQRKGEQKGHPTAAKREGLDSCERPSFKTHKASSLRPNPNRKFVTTLANMHAGGCTPLRKDEKPSLLDGGRNWYGIKEVCLAQVPNVQNSFWAPGSSSPQERGPNHVELLWFSKASVWQLLPTLCPTPPSSGNKDSEHSE